MRPRRLAAAYPPFVAGDTARVILVATHCDDDEQRYDPRGILRDVPTKLRDLIKAEIEVDSLSGTGIEELKVLIGKIAVGDPDESKKLPRLGTQMNRDWLTIIEKLV